ncbi:hypothetical protein ACQKDO_21425, partial [Raoultella planticola]
MKKVLIAAILASMSLSATAAQTIRFLGHYGTQFRQILCIHSLR